MVLYFFFLYFVFSFPEMLDDIETFMITGLENVFPIVSHFIYLLIKGFAKVVRYIKKDKFRIFFVQNIFLFFHEHCGFTGQQGKGEAVSLTLLCLFHPLYRYFGISRAITAESSPLPRLAASLEVETFGFRAQVSNH